MKNFFRIIVLTAIFCLAVSCENTLSKMELEESNGDETDSGISDDDADSADSDVPDNSDSETPDEQENDSEENDSDNNETLYSTCHETLDCVDACSDDKTCINECYNNSSTTAFDDSIAWVECKQENCPNGEEECISEFCADEAAACEMIKPAKYNSPYGLVSFSFDNLVGTAEDPKIYEDEIFATGTYGNGLTQIMPESAEVETDVYIDNDQIQIVQYPIYDGIFVNPVVFFYLPIDKAEDAGLYTINYNGDASVIVAEFNWDSEQEPELECYHAFGEGQLEIFESNINGFFNAINFSGNATLYHPTNYDGIDISAEFLQIAGMGTLCEPVD